MKYVTVIHGRRKSNNRETIYRELHVLKSQS